MASAQEGFSTVMGIKRMYDQAKAQRAKEAAIVQPTPNTDGTHDHLGEHQGGFADGHIVLPEDVA